MVGIIRKDKTTYYRCEECKFAFEGRKFAKKCEEWCKKNHSCNIEITAYAVKIE